MHAAIRLHFSRLCLATATVVLFSTAATAADSDKQLGAVATPEGLGGPTIPGACLLSREAVLSNAKVGQAATTRLQQLAEEAQGEVNTQRKPLDAEITTLQAEASKLSAADRAKREQELNKKLAPLQAQAERLSQEIELTRRTALERISVEAQPVIAAVYKQKGCGLLIDRNMVLGGNFANDLTPDVVKGLDAKLTTISFNRESLPPQTASNQR
jgi:Skp family chaperone for outer membrane proteins